MKCRCPYCGEKVFTWVDRCGITAAGLGAPYFYGGPPPQVIVCSYCQKTCSRLLGALGRRWDYLPHLWLLCIIPDLCLAIIPFVAVFRQSLGIFLYGYAIVFAVKILCNVLLVYFDKLTKEERDADARLTFAVTGEKAPRVKQWGIYRVRFPKRGTNQFSPLLYGMVCGKSGKKDERTLTLRVIRADNMELPNLDEPAWLVTDSDKVLEGKITAVTPAKKI